MKIDTVRVSSLLEYAQGVMKNENGRELYLKYRSDIEQVTPTETFEIFYRLLRKGMEPREILAFLGKIINVFYKSLAGYSWKRPEENSFMDFLMKENRGLTEKLEEIKQIIKEKGFQTGRGELTQKIRELQAFNGHYLKKENILFPFMEKKAEKFAGLAIMWELHDEARMRLVKVLACLEADACDETEFNSEIGALFFDLYGLVQKEELILFPAAAEIIDENEWTEMQRQSMEYEFPFIGKPEAEAGAKGKPDAVKEFAEGSKEGYWFRTETGQLSLEQALMIFNALPVDLTFVDEDDKVRFFTKPKDRIFPRSPAVIGRDVENCHPPHSVHVVRKIIEDFRSGTQDTAVFWIRLKEKMILIQYFALRDANGKYGGILEVSQDITGIKELEGEKRLL